jgi:hypothetical protein
MRQAGDAKENARENNLGSSRWRDGIARPRPRRRRGTAWRHPRKTSRRRRRCREDCGGAPPGYDFRFPRRTGRNLGAADESVRQDKISIERQRSLPFGNALGHAVAMELQQAHLQLASACSRATHGASASMPRGASPANHDKAYHCLPLCGISRVAATKAGSYATASKPAYDWPAFARSRSSAFCTLPLALRGKGSRTSSISSGTL